MMAKKNEKANETALPLILTDQKFTNIRNLLLESSRPLDEYWTKTNVADFFDGMPEGQRKEMAPFCMKWYQFLREACPDEYRDHLPSFFPTDATVQHAFLAVKVVILACGSHAEAQKVFHEVGAAFVESAVEKVLCSRKPEWASDFLLSIARHPRLMHHSSKMYWRIYRQLVMEKIAEPIFDEFWIRTMFSCELSATGLKNDPGLLESDIWALFEFSSFPGSWSLTSHDNGDRWKNAFASLIAEGRIDKRRVIDGCFQSISKPFSDHQAKWYVQLLELMMKRGIIILEEQAADSRFPGLLENSNPTPRGLGLKILEQLVGSNLIADKDSLRYIPTIFREPVKGKAKKAITLLEKIAKKNTNIRHDVCRAALEGLQHEAAEIQQKVLDLLLKYDAFSDPEIAEAVRELEPSLAASVRRNIPGRKGPPDKPERSFVPEIPKTDNPLPRKEYIRFFKNLADSTPSVSIAATDRMIQAVSEGRFHCEQAIEAARETIGFKAFTISRWTKPLHVIAEQSDRHAETVQELVEGFLPEIDKKQLSAFLELLVETSSLVGKPIHSETCRNYMQTITGTRKAAKLAKKLLEL